MTDEVSPSSSWRCYAGDHSDPDQCNSACTNLFQSSEDEERVVVGMDAAIGNVNVPLKSEEIVSDDDVGSEPLS